MMAFLLLSPIIFMLILLLFRNKILNRIILIFNAVLLLFITIFIHLKIELNFLSFDILKYFFIDSISLLFLYILSLLNLGVSIYTIFYLKIKNHENKWDTIYTIFLLLFLLAMTGVIVSAHLALLWVFIEATTLTGALLIYSEKEKPALEAAWKYIFISSIGVSLAFVGIILLTMGSKSVNSLFFIDIYSNAKNLIPLWIKLSFVFILVGFGTKVGLAPVHAWLPDAHSEAPPPVSALFSGMLLNVALIGIIRFYKIMIMARLVSYANFLLISMGFLSLLVSAVFMIKVKNYKRMLAYSSIENMGIIVIGIGLGGIGIFAALFHLIAHSLSKAAFFLTSGNIYYIYKSKKIDEIKGLINNDKLSGWFWIFSFIALSGFPPFPIFISKFLLVKAFFEKGQSLLLAPFFIFMVIILFGMGKTVFNMSFGDKIISKKKKLGIFAYLPQLFFLILLLLIGIVIPDFVYDIIDSAAKLFY